VGKPVPGRRATAATFLACWRHDVVEVLAAEATLLWLPLLVLVGGVAAVWTGVSMAADVHRSAGLFPGRVVATGAREHLAADVEYTEPDGVTKT
jgi:hypothetical protein